MYLQNGLYIIFSTEYLTQVAIIGNQKRAASAQPQLSLSLCRCLSTALVFAAASAQYLPMSLPMPEQTVAP